MLKNYFTTTLRNLAKNKTHALINIAGLALGIVCALIIFLIIKFDLEFDTYHQETNHIYRIVSTIDEFGEIDHGVGVPYPLPIAFRNDFPEIERITVIDNNSTPAVFAVTRDDGTVAKFKQDEGVAFVDPEYFKIFHYEWLLGDPDRALAQPHSVVISRELAEKFFGQENPLGKRIVYDNRHEAQVAGVVKEVPPNTDLPFNMIFAYDHKERGNDDWGSTSSAVQCYLRLPSHLDPQQIESRLVAFVAKYREKDETKNITLSLQPLRRLHFDTRFNVFSHRTVSKATLLALGLIGLFLMVTACINFVNLNTALAVKRSKEVGVRKVLGGTMPQLMLHFLAETAFVTLLAILVALAFAEIALVQLQSLLGYRFAFEMWNDASIPIFLLALFVAVTLSAGFYPALHLSRFNAVAALRNKLTSRYGEKLPLRKSLVVVQFAISQALIISAIVISTQMDYFRKADLGFSKDAIVELSLPTNEATRMERFKSELLQQAGIKHLSFSNTGAASGNRWSGNYSLKESAEIKQGRADIKFIDHDFIATYGLKLLAGEGLMPSDTLKKLIVNQTFANEVGYGDEVHALLGKQVKIWGREAPIAGVVRDFNMSSLHRKVEPAVMMMQNRFWQAGIKLDIKNMSASLAAIEKTWAAVYPEYVFDYAFLDDTIAEFYEEEQKTARLMNVFTGIAILIGCMGLFGLVSYMATQRTKEIGIRKVLGASLPDILNMFVKEFALLIAVAFVIAAPVAYYFMQNWLEDFAYRIELNTGIFLMTLIITFLIALLTVGYKALRAALANPVESLRYE